MIHSIGPVGSDLHLENSRVAFARNAFDCHADRSQIARGELHARGVPFDALAGADGEVAEKDQLRERGGVVEI